jgi:DNA-binding transcriptional LysR family regulator
VLTASAHTSGVLADQAWHSIFTDPVLVRPPTPGSQGNVPAGDDLRLDIGWARFEQLLVSVAQHVLGLNQVRFRRYGVSGQRQHGIDLAGRCAEGGYTVVQCKEYAKFTPADLRAAVAKFTEGKRPFGAQHLIVAVSTVARTTQLEDELARLQDKHKDLHIELWGTEQINDVLRNRADIVSRFWTRETAETFCTGAPLPGVAAALPNWARVADQILLSPLGVDGLDDQLTAADKRRVSDPATAADAYRQLADRLAADGFAGHAHVLRRKQLDALADADELDAAAALTAQLAATALHQADMHQAQLLSHRLDTLVRARTQNTTQNVAAPPRTPPRPPGRSAAPSIGMPTWSARP